LPPLPPAVVPEPPALRDPPAPVGLPPSVEGPHAAAPHKNPSAQNAKRAPSHEVAVIIERGEDNLGIVDFMSEKSFAMSARRAALRITCHERDNCGQQALVSWHE
jgi:hypothetical protein